MVAKKQFDDHGDSICDLGSLLGPRIKHFQHVGENPGLLNTCQSENTEICWQRDTDCFLGRQMCPIERLPASLQ